jgi:nickel/cobalt exporter
MTDLSHLLQQSSAHAWLFVPSAILLGALHGLEPGHSKTMMAAFIIAVRGTVLQAVLLGLSATISHTAIVWAIALAGLYFGQELSGDRSEAYLQLVSAIIIVCIAGWMVWRTWRDQHHTHDHDHHHHDEPQSVSLAGSSLLLEVFEDGVPPLWRIRTASGALPASDAIKVTTIREDGSEQTFAFAARDGYLESVDEIPEPHAFTARGERKSLLRTRFCPGAVLRHRPCDHHGLSRRARSPQPAPRRTPLERLQPLRPSRTLRVGGPDRLGRPLHRLDGAARTGAVTRSLPK